MKRIAKIEKLITELLEDASAQRQYQQCIFQYSNRLPQNIITIRIKT